MSAKEVVARGAAALDEKRPGWWKEINLDTLRMELCHECILGQLYGEFYIGKRDFHPEHGESWIERLSALGFDNGDECGSYTALRREWVRVIEERRQK